jgi:5-methylcytosine-specific restriction enzyme B
MPEPRLSLETAVASYDRALDTEAVAAAERERKEVTDRFSLEQWPTMPLERYAIGQEESEDTFCRWMEYRTQHLGSMRGGAARKHLIYKHKDKPGWYFAPEYKDEQEAWLKVREAFVQAFQDAKNQDWNAIDDLAPLSGGPALRLKALHLYFPHEILPIYSQPHLRHFLRLLERPEADDHSLDAVYLNRTLLAAVRQRPELKNWSTQEIMWFLYRWAHPRKEHRVVKIAPGEDAKYWDDCRREGYICVGWDTVGDLREFESKDSFRAQFEKEYAGQYNNHKPTLSKKANELWTLMELEPGDIVIANKGTSQILALGEVAEPGYAWKPERPEYRHTVRVEWDTSYAKEIQPQKRWALVTVAPVPAALYKTIVGEAPGGTPGETSGKTVLTPGKIVVPPVDPLLREIEQALERKGQVILYGPPGTGKTYQARRFAVAWLLQQDGRTADAHSALADPVKFAEAERRLTTSQVSRRVWWVVANPKEWSWDRLFKEKRVSYRYGRLRRNYPHVKVGDLVIGYQSSPDKRIVALARVTEALGEHDGKDPTIEIEAIAQVKNGLTYDELASDRILKGSEPMRFRNQGTLFALTTDEADYTLSLLAERDPDIPTYVDDDNDAVGPLTRLTFHPSYSYEDFVEGFRPQDTGSATLSLRLADGVFKRVCHAALAHPTKRFLVLIDEINRANVAKVFGELITLLEVDKRGMLVTLPQSKDIFCIPPNIYLLGTMNTADRSIKLLDSALRRRFAFVELMPNIDVLRGAKVGTLALDDFLEELNRRIAKTEGREKQIGHSFLLEGDEPIGDPDEFARRFRQEILPLLQEYCYDDYGALASYIGAKLVDKEGQTLDHERLADTDALLATLEDEFGRRDVGGT